MKAVLLSIKPKYCELIANGKKTIEVRKTAPKLKPFFKCYIYCTKAKPIMGRGLWRDKNGTILCDVFEPYEEDEFDIYNKDNLFKANGKVIGEFICDKVCDMRDVSREATCLTISQWRSYTDYYRHNVYGWHISDLIIYDKPKELREFRKPCINDLYCESCAMYGNFFNHCGNQALRIKRPPQSWCYVEEL
jgi:predicted transcriptional regulator